LSRSVLSNNCVDEIDTEEEPLKLHRVSKKSIIPPISNQVLKALAAQIKPIVRDQKRSNKLFYLNVDGLSLRGESFLWELDFGDEAKDIKPLMQVRTYHTYGYYGMFKPSIAEVIAQIPVEVRERVVGFEITRRPETAADLNENRAALNAGYHVAMATLYVRA
jgi:hypothetical protein